MTNKTNTVEELKEGINKIFKTYFDVNEVKKGIEYIDGDHTMVDYESIEGDFLSLFNQYADSKFKKALPEKKIFRHGVNTVPEGDGCSDCAVIRTHNDTIDEIKSRWEEESK